MKHWFTQNLGLKILSLLLAAMVWWLIHTKIEPELKNSMPEFYHHSP